MNKRITVSLMLGVLLAASAYAQSTDFVELVKTGTPQDVQAAIDKGADIKARDKDGMNALMWAAFYNQNADVISTLLNAGADINTRDERGATPLMIAAEQNRNPDVITMLLKAGARVDNRDKDCFTALMRAARWNQNPEVITVLLKAGANARVKDSMGMTAFDHAKNNDALKGTDALLQLQRASQ